MALFKPYMMLNRLTDLTPEMLEKAGVKGLLPDVDILIRSPLTVWPSL